MVEQKKPKVIKRDERKPPQKSPVERLEKIYRMAKALEQQAKQMMEEIQNGTLG